MAPFRILSFNNECAGRKGHFPEPTHDPVIQDFIREVDPDIIIDYNICNFDLPYLIRRDEVLGMAEFPVLGRIRNSTVRVKEATFSSRQHGTRESKEMTIEGRVQFDLFQKGRHLNHIIDMPLVSMYSENCDGGKLKALVPLQQLLDKLMFIYNYVEMARVTGVPISFLLARGQLIKVLEDRAGFHEKPIATLDFASLYPSIMMAYNLCYCTLEGKNDLTGGLCSMKTSVRVEKSKKG
ncbi:hypothetical protein RND71_042225 [Anisodus tanguticus]|uniref:DNA polymerase delta catalytic subunit n=1 Tax=Anisodus tanguticus TaxID=243964 RepID=A0AAE1QQI6_9SOLA|nr:hypothetical protein RND71_042225 [Anisodus tanguticus]